jgi:hypothetical protein
MPEELPEKDKPLNLWKTLAYALSYPSYILGLSFISYQLIEKFSLNKKYVIIFLGVFLVYPLIVMVKSAYKKPS